jgi:maltooligosyltrehalose trehalohydrolase
MPFNGVRASKPMVPILRRFWTVMVHHPPTTDRPIRRRYPIGVELMPQPDGSTRPHARIWAPAATAVELVLVDDSAGLSASALSPEANGYYSGFVARAEAGARYRVRLDGGECFPDPASRFQPDGPHGPSVVVDPFAFRWTDTDWRGVSIDGQVICEIHIGTFTPAGTFRAAIERLPDLVDTGITVLEIMPLADFAGRFGWGYDGVNLFAPSHLYGTPDDLRALVDGAHSLGLGVILDVVYNHFGPDGNYLPNFSPRYFSDYGTDWGEAINFDGKDCWSVREYFLTNARYWIEEFHFDGLRLDATQQIYDKTTPNIITEIASTIRDAAGDRHTIIVAENEPQRSSLVRPLDEGGSALDALWNDDFHHCALVAATGRDEAYYSGYRGLAQEFVSAAKYGFLYQGQSYPWQEQRRGIPALDLPPIKFVVFTDNHDQIANRSAGTRLHHETSPGRYRALTALLLLLPNTPMLFQGQDFAASTPFFFFADHNAELSKLVRKGRVREMSQFPSIATTDGTASLPDPSDPATFTRCKLDWSERERHTQALDLHRDLLRLRRSDPVLRQQRVRGLDGAVLSDQAFVLRYFGESMGDRLLIVNLGARLHASPIPEPLLAPARGGAWATALSTESPKYGGWGTPPLETITDGWWIPAECAVLLVPTDDHTTTTR